MLDYNIKSLLSIYDKIMITKGTNHKGFHLHLLFTHLGNLLCITNKTRYRNFQFYINYNNIWNSIKNFKIFW